MYVGDIAKVVRPGVWLIFIWVWATMSVISVMHIYVHTYVCIGTQCMGTLLQKAIR